MREIGYRTRGGACRLRDKNLVIIDRDQPAAEQLEVIAEALRSRDLESLYLSPAARRIVHLGDAVKLRPRCRAPAKSRRLATP